MSQYVTDLKPPAENWKLNYLAKERIMRPRREGSDIENVKLYITIICLM